MINYVAVFENQYDTGVSWHLQCSVLDAIWSSLVLDIGYGVDAYTLPVVNGVRDELRSV